MNCRMKSFVLIPILAIMITACGGGSSNYQGSNTPGGGGSLAGWDDPDSLSETFSPSGGGDSEESNSAMDNNGNAIIVWSQSDGAYYHIYKSECRGGAWSYPSSLDNYISPAGTDARNPVVAMDNNGNAVIAWEQSNGDYLQIYKSEYRNGAWTHPAGLSDGISPDGDDARFPQVAMDDNNNAIIVWRQYDEYVDTQIFKSEYRGGFWTHPRNRYDHISPDEENAYNPQVAMDNNGNAIIVWEQDDSLNVSQIFKSEYRGGFWTHPAGLYDSISFSGKFAYNPQVAMDNHSNAVIVWEQEDSFNISQIYKSEYRSGSWVPPANFDDHISISGYWSGNPMVALNDSGEAVIVFVQAGQNDEEMIYKSVYRGGAWMNPSSIDDHISLNGTYAFFPQAAINASGEIVIAWFQDYQTTYHIYRSEYRNGVWNNPDNLTDYISIGTTSNALYPKVVMSRNTALISWMEFHGTTYDMYKSEYR
jgi:hypothetical protein